MNKLIFFIAVTFCAALLNSCTKKEVATPQPTFSIKQTDQAADAEVDNALNNVNNFISNIIGKGASQSPVPFSAADSIPCGVPKDSVTLDTTINQQVHHFFYNGNISCGYKNISGQIAFELIKGAKYSDTGAVFIIAFGYYSVTNNLAGSTVALNGTLTVTNTSGGDIWQAINGSTITHRIRGALSITYNGTTVRTRNYFQKRTWTSTNSWAGLSMTLTGDSTTSNQVISESGNTFVGGYPFETVLPIPFVWQNTGSSPKGPLVLTKGHAILNVTGAPVSPATIDVQAGYKCNISTTLTNSTLTLVNDTTANAYQIVTTLSEPPYTSFQLY